MNEGKFPLRVWKINDGKASTFYVSEYDVDGYLKKDGCSCEEYLSLAEAKSIWTGKDMEIERSHVRVAKLEETIAKLNDSIQEMAKLIPPKGGA